MADYQLHGHTYPCKINVGMLTVCPRDIDNVGQLFKRAGLALLEAKLGSVEVRGCHSEPYISTFEAHIDPMFLFAKH